MANASLQKPASLDRVGSKDSADLLVEDGPLDLDVFKTEMDLKTLLYTQEQVSLTL